MRFIVQKFGGTSLRDEDSREKAALKVIQAKQEGYCPVVVVSAIGRRGDAYATDTLLDFAGHGKSEISPRESDLLMACGEIISGVLMSAIIKKAGGLASFLTGAQAGIITDKEYNNARILRVNTENIIKLAGEGKIAVVAGFQGISEDGEVTTLGRGGSDVTAAALGVALDAEWIDIYTDVEGIMTADPRIVSEARPLERVTYNEICQLAREGAKVVHPRAVEIAMQKGIPIRVKCTFSDAPGTIVASRGKVYKGIVDIKRDRTVTGITHIPDIAQFKILTKDSDGVTDFQRRVFKALALAGISVDFINVHPEAVLFTVSNSTCQKALEVLENMGITPEVKKDCAKVAAVGAGMTGVPGVMAKIVEALASENIQILQSADSYTSIWVLVRKEDMENSIRALHRYFGPGE
ncbi:MAG TPA: aspartate kinase [Bacillota bacterium]|nr:aspartate kinase [Bacillota bacterium]